MVVELTLKKLLMSILNMNLKSPLPKASKSSRVHLAPGGRLALTIRLLPGVFLAVPPVPMLNAPPPPPPSVEGVASAPMNEGVAANDEGPPANPKVGLGVATGLPPKPNVLGTGGSAC
jgi:hypothetical protein